MTLEGVLGPNDRLEQARGVRVETPEAMCVDGDNRLLYSSAGAVYRLDAWASSPQLWASFPAPVTALFADPGGTVAVGLSGGGLQLCDPSGRTLSGWRLPQPTSIVDGIFLSESELVLVDAGYRADEPIVSVATWDDVGRGRLTLVRRDGEPRGLVSGLFAPMGVARDARGELVVTEFERARIVDGTGKPRGAGYPGYLGRLRKTPAGFVVSCWARRDPLIEFLKTERDFIAEMKATIAPRHWIAPRLSPEVSHDFPIELGATRLFGEVKPWAPSFSYGLLIELDDELTPTGAAHSRANGARHAIVDALVWNGDLLAISKASGELLNLGPPARPHEP